MRAFPTFLNALVIFILCGIQAAAFGIQIFEGETPCPLCLLQRLCMTGVGSSLILNLWFGERTSHYGFALLQALMGGVVALRQISLHVCPGFPTFGAPVLGLSLYTWSFLVFACCILAVAVLLFCYEGKSVASTDPKRALAYASLIALALVTLGNVVSTFWICGFGVC